MKVMVIVKATKNSEAGIMPSPELLDEMTRYNDELLKAGILLAGDGLHPSVKGKRVQFSGPQRTIVDGPFAETKELIAGYWLWQVKSMDEAMEWVRRCPDPMPGETSELEVRPVFELDDFGDNVTPEVRERTERQQSELAARDKKITIEATVAAPLQVVWDAWTTPADIVQWNAASADWHTTRSEMDLRVGGAFSSRMEAKDGSTGFDFSGTFTKVVERELLEYAMSDGRVVRVELAPRAGGVTVRETFDAEDLHSLEEQRAGWQAILDNFKAHVEQKVTSSAAKGKAKIYPHLWYAKDAEAAAALYASIFPQSSVDRVTALSAETPSGPPGTVKVVEFTLLGQRFQAMSAGPHHEFNDAISLVVSCADQAELDRYWDALLADGGRTQACGWLIDRFGVRWQIVPARLEEMMSDADPARSRRVMEAVLQMVKLDLAALERAYRG